MPIADLFHLREERRRRAGQPDVYQYDELPQLLREQLLIVFTDTIGFPSTDLRLRTPSDKMWETLHDVLRKEIGPRSFAQDTNPSIAVSDFFLRASTEHALTVIELACRVVENLVPEFQGRLRGASQAPTDALAEINARLRWHGVGYQYEGGEIVRLDCDYTHAEVIRPALAALASRAFRGASDEFHQAHVHYREGRHEEAVGAALRSLESTLKVICAERHWPHRSSATVKHLLDLAFAEGLLAPEMQSQFGALRSLLESGLPTIANRWGRHGQGTEVRRTSPALARFALAQAAADITLLVEAHRGQVVVAR